VRWLNDITASMADFVVAEQDYNGSLRQSMFDALTSLGQRLPPEVGLKLLTIAMEYSDLPNKDEIADALKMFDADGTAYCSVECKQQA
jgi:Ca2+-binding EF-hand superfamily protein